MLVSLVQQLREVMKQVNDFTYPSAWLGGRGGFPVGHRCENYVASPWPSKEETYSRVVGLSELAL